MKILVPGLITFAIWCYASTYWYVCKIKYLCDEPMIVSSVVGPSESIQVPEEPSPVDTQEKEEEIMIRESETGTVIHFGYNSTTPENSDTLNAYLQRFADAHKGKSIQLIGHTDTAGTGPYNYQLGMERAEAVKNILVAKGWDAAAITTTSKGETEPITEITATEEQYANRRVEMIIQ